MSLSLLLLLPIAGFAASSGFSYSEKNSKFESVTVDNFKTDENSPEIKLNHSQTLRISRQTINKIPVYGSFVKKIGWNSSFSLQQSYTVSDKPSLKEVSDTASGEFNIDRSVKMLEALYGKVRFEFSEKVYLYENKSLQLNDVVYFSNLAGETFEAFLIKKII